MEAQYPNRSWNPARHKTGCLSSDQTGIVGNRETPSDCLAFVITTAIGGDQVTRSIVGPLSHAHCKDSLYWEPWVSKPLMTRDPRRLSETPPSRATGAVSAGGGEGSSIRHTLGCLGSGGISLSGNRPGGRVPIVRSRSRMRRACGRFTAVTNGLVPPKAPSQVHA